MKTDKTDNEMTLEPFRKIYYKIISPDRQIWYGTFETREKAEERMKKDYPHLSKDKYEIIEVN